MFGSPETLQDLLSLNTKTQGMPKMRFVDSTERKFALLASRVNLQPLFVNFSFVFRRRLCGNRIRVEMSSGRSRQQSRGGRGGGGGGGREYRRYGGNDSYSSRSRGSYRLECNTLVLKLTYYFAQKSRFASIYVEL